MAATLPVIVSAAMKLPGEATRPVISDRLLVAERVLLEGGSPMTRTIGGGEGSLARLDFLRTSVWSSAVECCSQTAGSVSNLTRILAAFSASPGWRNR
jgi:hypothetical protein